MTKEEKTMLLDLLEKEWLLLQKFDLNQSPPLLQAAAAIWTLLEYFPIRERLSNKLSYMEG